MKKRIAFLICVGLLTAGMRSALAVEAVQSPRILIAYFSLYGNVDYPDDADATTSASIVLDGGERQGATQYVAEQIQSRAGGDLFRIETSEPYPDSFQKVIDQNHAEAANNTLPALKTVVEDMEQYDVVFLGYPIWNMTVPQAVRSFLETYDFSGKTIVPFCTHDGYGSGRSYSDIAAACPDSTVLDGLAIDSSDVLAAEVPLTDWLNEWNLFAEEEQEEIPIDVRIGDTTLSAVLYDTAESRQFQQMLPLTVSMWNYGGREFYGSLDKEILPESEGQRYFADGDITYCDQNHSLAIFYSQSDQPELTMQVIPIGRVTSELEPLLRWQGDAQITFSFSE
jgi:flavodoxin